MRTIQDASFREWEAYATSGEFGYSRPARIVFRCVTDPGERARAVVVEGDAADAEARLRRLSEADLREMMAAASLVE